jgi:ATP-dependent Clp protease adaptor protein ClpS
MSEESSTATMEPTSSTIVRQRKEPRKKPDPKLLPPFHVVLLDDDDHTYEYVILMLNKLFGHPLEMCYQMAEEVDMQGRVVVDTTSKERAEFKRDQILGYGKDPLIQYCAGSMSAIIEPAEEG